MKIIYPQIESIIIEIIKNNLIEILELKTTITKMKSSSDGLNSSFKPGVTSKFEHTSNEIGWPEEQKGKTMNKNRTSESRTPSSIGTYT